MKTKLVYIFFTMFIGISINAMENRNLELKDLLIGPVSLKLRAAWEIAAGKKSILIGEGFFYDELGNTIEKIRDIQECQDCSSDEKKLFINLLNSLATAQDIELVESLLEQPEVSREKQLLTANLFWGLMAGNPLLAKFAITQGADVNALDYYDAYGLTPLILAVEMADKDIVKAILDKGSNIFINLQKRRIGSNALIIAAELGYKDIVELLLQNAADVNIEDHSGLTALEKAAKGNHTEIVRMILAQPTLNLEKNYKKFIDFAKRNNLKEFGQLIIKELAKRRGIQRGAYEMLEKEYQLPWELVEIIKEYVRS